MYPAVSSSSLPEEDDVSPGDSESSGGRRRGGGVGVRPRSGGPRVAGLLERGLDMDLALSVGDLALERCPTWLCGRRRGLAKILARMASSSLEDDPLSTLLRPPKILFLS